MDLDGDTGEHTEVTLQQEADVERVSRIRGRFRSDADLIQTDSDRFRQQLRPRSRCKCESVAAFAICFLRTCVFALASAPFQGLQSGSGTRTHAHTHTRWRKQSC